MLIRYWLAACIWGLAAIAWAQTPPLSIALNEQVIMLPVGEGFGSTQLETTIYKPNGDGPFPLVVINHGKASGNPLFQERARYLMAANAFVARGYIVVVPMRRGFSKSGGAYISPGCNITSNGLMQAEELGITQANLEAKLAEAKANPNQAELRRFLGVEGEFGRQLGLPADFVVQAIRAVGNYGEIFERNLGRDSKLKLDRGMNRLWTQGGLIYSPPFR